MELVYVGSAGHQGGTLRSRLSDHLNKKGWQTAFRRKVPEHVLGTIEKQRPDRIYTSQLKQSTSQITQKIINNFAFKCIMTKDYDDFEVWMVIAQVNAGEQHLEIKRADVDMIIPLINMHKTGRLGFSVG